ncbi:UDP-N-acetylmuramoyl-L-alanyl-D-glutamate--2,6-diaminopimelate ligase [Chitinibacter bivalviorum]|uniref:UDP-N-acetylmuramoyl-L-alanyl-D-glutamate--2,6-diaminopimelate ligase n=1 Tax=Chitinibacter bivalviorum TaxID=2739434 RepID=A0A7H9BL78_9NEIS|nr:UDP-N-acetylmuramoyl-L-alanyl-D-glutamate--2,6-diaminopimelate ligase [Chitinibacter bivalviorum]QLG89435.1 UDP-N-acetylmuramoyl-L-alanyl-D-glutamate--2,6-diaminopimelate ligase [Chitinibacter bivalviorum]
MKPASWVLPAIDWNAIQALVAGRNVVVDSRKVQPGDVFIAYQGEYVDGREYIADAVAKGAAAVIWEAEDFSWDATLTLPNLAVPALRNQVGILLARLLNNDVNPIPVVGITGTNGKTSIANWLAQAFNALGGKAGVLGTLGNGFVGQLQSSTHTTLDPVSLQQWLAKFRLEGATQIAMEVSSHGLVQARAHGVQFHTAVFTNLTRDHLDYHGSMQAYGAAKAKLFEWEGLQAAVINADDPFGRELLGFTTAKTIFSYGFVNGDLRCTQLESSLKGLALTVETPFGTTQIQSALLGRFNASNLLACLGVLLAQGVSLADASAALAQIRPAAGRMQCLGGDDKPLVVVDYAHTPDALEKVLMTLREAMPQGARLYCVFGCGGDRDAGKRPLMGEIACRLADSVVITSDNPRSEKPKAIIQDIVAGVSGVPGTGNANYSIESDRAAAISDAIEMAHFSDVILIAGKGHEDYQEINGERYHFDDVEHASKALARKSQGNRSK